MALRFYSNRRQFLQTLGGAAFASGCLGRMSPALADAAASPAPVRQITQGPKHHWFGYYDQLKIDPANRCVLGMEVDFEHRSPRPDDIIRLGMVDLADNDRWIELGTSTAWCWQQGCMLQWRPGSSREVLWNDREDGRYVCRSLDVETHKIRTIPHPVYAISPDGRWAIAPDFRRLGDVRPGYGYNGIPDPNRDVLAPADTGIFRIDLDSGRQDLLVRLSDVARLPYAHGDLSKHKHWFNHLLVNTDGTRFVFLHRFKLGNEKGHRTRMVTAKPDGSDVRVLVDSGFVSHFIWRDPEHILAYARATPDGPWKFFLFQDKPGGTIGSVADEVVTGDGHCTYSPDRQWMLYDTYPDKKTRQHIYLYNLAKRQRIELGAFKSPVAYRQEWRCDLHPFFSRDGRSIVFESPHSKHGRQMYVVDVRAIVDG
jgi:hypothetical protein